MATTTETTTETIRPGDVVEIIGATRFSGRDRQGELLLVDKVHEYLGDAAEAVGDRYCVEGLEVLGAYTDGSIALGISVPAMGHEVRPIGVRLRSDEVRISWNDRETTTALRQSLVTWLAPDEDQYL